MILPTITAISRDALISLHSDLRQAAVGLGATRLTILKVLHRLLWDCRRGDAGTGRAIETMAVTMVIGNSNNINPPSWHHRIRSLSTSKSVCGGEWSASRGFDVYIDSVWHYAACQYPGAVTVLRGTAFRARI